LYANLSDESKPDIYYAILKRIQIKKQTKTAPGGDAQTENRF
jgi:hypothetical protein